MAEKKITDIAELKVFRKSSDNFIYIRSPWLENTFKQMSISQLGEERVDTVYSINGEGQLFEYYKVRHLPRVPFSLQANWDVFNNYGWLRAKDLTQGLTIPISTPITKSMVNEFKKRVEQQLQYLYRTDDTETSNEIHTHVLFQGD